METARLTPIDEALIERVRDRIVEACHPEALYLFGSEARGEAAEGSDLDLLVVMELPEGERSYKVAAELHSLFRGWLVPLDIIVRTPEQFERGQRMLGFVERAAIREGKCCTMRRVTMSELDDRHEAVRAWRQKGDDDLRSARILLDAEPPRTDVVCFHSQAGGRKVLEEFPRAAQRRATLHARPDHVD